MSQPMLSRSRPVVALMSDFGLRDGYVGVMKGVIAGIAPDVQIIDITHEVAPQSVAEGAWVLAASYRYFPKLTIFVCVIDPGVGSSRRAVAVHAGDWCFVGPDNGLFSYVLEEEAVHAAVVLSNSAYQLSQVSSSFHGRDVFAPVAAHLACGVALAELGTGIDPATLQRVETGRPIGRGSQIDAQIVHIDHFGNLISSIPLALVPELLSGPLAERQVRIVFPAQGMVVDRFSRFFAEGPEDGQAFMYADSSGYVGVALRNGSAAESLRVGVGTAITWVGTFPLHPRAQAS